MGGTERHTKTEVEKRVSECYSLRYENSPSITQEKWVEYCHENYSDRSEVTYCMYWDKAYKRYNDHWKLKLEKLLGPATDELFRLLSSEDEKIRQRAVDQIMKLTGNDIIKQEIKGTVETIQVKFRGVQEEQD